MSLSDTACRRPVVGEQMLNLLIGAAFCLSVIASALLTVMFSMSERAPRTGFEQKGIVGLIFQPHLAAIQLAVVLGAVCALVQGLHQAKKFGDDGLLRKTQTARTILFSCCVVYALSIAVIWDARHAGPFGWGTVVLVILVGFLPGLAGVVAVAAWATVSMIRTSKGPRSHLLEPKPANHNQS